MPATAAKYDLSEASPTCLCVRCRGGLSWEDRDVLAGEIGRFLQARPQLTAVMLDLAAVDFVNSAGLGALFQVFAQLRPRGGRLIFVNVPPAVHRIFQAVGLERLTEIASGPNEGLAQLDGPGPTRMEEAFDLPPT